MLVNEPRSKKRLPRFRQCSEAVSEIRMTSRDESILKQLAKHRFLRSDRIVELVGGSPQQILRRLQLLFHHGYVERPRAQIERYGQGGSRPMVYGLACRGASHLRRACDIHFDQMQWSRKRDNVGRLFLDHALAISDVATRFELHCRRDETTSFLDPHDPKNCVLEEPSHWEATLPVTGAITVVPDRIFRIRKEEETVLCFLEADCGTMPVVRKNLKQSSIQRKLLAYAATWEQGLHRRLYSEKRFRVLFVTTGPERRDHMVEAVERLPKGRGLFLFATQSELRASDSFLSFSWHSAIGRSLLF